MRACLPPNANFLGLEVSDSDPLSAGVIVLTAPFEQTSTFGAGSSKGPDAILEASQQVELFDAVLGFETYKKVSGIATIEPIICENIHQLCSELESETMFRLKKNKFVITIGSEHTSIVGAVKAHCNFYEPLTVIQLDAHSDLRNEYLGNPWSHACAARRILDFHTDIVQVGIRSQAAEERAFSDSRKIPVFYAHEIHQNDAVGLDWIDALLKCCKSNVYVTLDCDVFDPSVVPATGTPEPGGLTWNQMNRLFERLASERRLVGVDINELSPIQNLNFPQFTISKFIYRILGFWSHHH